MNPGEKAEDAARRETLEETGLSVDRLILLGEFPCDTGFTGTVVPVYAAQVQNVQSAQRDETEAIESILALTPKEIKQAFARGYYSCQIRGEEKNIPFRDPFLAYAILLYDLKY